MDIEGVFPTVQAAVARCCDKDPVLVRMDSTLVGELGMESLDFIDLVYELERAFQITISVGSMESEIEEVMGGEPYEVDGVLTPDALAKLRDRVPGMVDPGEPAVVSLDELPLLLTVRSVCGLLVEEHRRRGLDPLEHA